MTFEAELKRIGADVEAALERYMPPADAYPALIHQAMRYSIMNGGKRLRPALVIAAAETAGGEGSDVLPAACALEMIHTYSLIHDDLPAMDNDDYRRGKPANHKVYGDAVAILAGDALLTLAFALLAGVRHTSPDKVLQVTREIALAAGTFGMIGGQVVDTFSAGENIDEATLEYIHRHKTGALFRAAVRTGAILAGATAGELEKLTKYAENMGLAFQMIDDILDIEGDAAKIGKPVGSDQKNQKATYPALFGVSKTREKARQAADEAVRALDCFGARADFLKLLVQYIINRDH